MFEKQRGGGTPHIPIEVIWSDVQTRVGTPHKALEQYMLKKIHMLGWVAGWPGGWPVLSGYITTS